ncbi:hypothetical protein GCM10010458_16520 [Microbacterium luteolum]
MCGEARHAEVMGDLTTAERDPVRAGKKTAPSVRGRATLAGQPSLGRARTALTTPRKERHHHTSPDKHSPFLITR